MPVRERSVDSFSEQRLVIEPKNFKELKKLGRSWKDFTFSGVFIFVVVSQSYFYKIRSCIHWKAFLDDEYKSYVPRVRGGSWEQAGWISFPK